MESGLSDHAWDLTELVACFQTEPLPRKTPLDLVSDTEVVPGEGDRSVATVTGQYEWKALTYHACRAMSGFEDAIWRTVSRRKYAKGFEVKEACARNLRSLAFNRNIIWLKKFRQ